MSILAALPIVGKILDKVIPDKGERARAQEALDSAEQSGDLQLLLGQMEINKVEAVHKSLFVAGARPFIMWVCGMGLLYNVLISPILAIWFDMPYIDPSLLDSTLLGMLGLGGMRTAEKFKGVARER